MNLNTRLIQYYGPQKNKLSCGVQALQLLPSGSMLVGSGEGTLAILMPSLKRSKSNAKVSGAVSSIALSKDGNLVGSLYSHFIGNLTASSQFYVGTGSSQRYSVELEGFSLQLICSSHCSAVTDVCFPL